MRNKLVDEIKVAQFTKDGVLIKIWDSQIEASEVTGVLQQSISKCCYGKLKTAGGFRWCFV
jgi:hypothetical protein